MKAFYLLIISCMFSFVACKTKQGDPGPAGATGTTGINGASGVSTFKKQGSISGTLEYVDHNGSPVKPSFAYEYYESLFDNAFVYNFGSVEQDPQPDFRINATPGRYYGIHFKRRGIADSENWFTFDLYGSVGQDGSIIPPIEGHIDFSYVGLINNNVFSFNDYTYGEGEYEEVYFYEGNSTTCDIKNFKLDTISGRLTFDYETKYDNSNIYENDRYDNNSEATVKGSVDVILNRRKPSEFVPQQVF